MLDEPIGVMSAKAEKAPNENTMVLAAVCGTIQTCATAYSPILTQATPSTAGYVRVVAYMAPYSIIMPQYIESARI